MRLLSLTSITLAFAVAAGLVACGGAQEEPKTAESTVTATKTETPPPAPTTTETKVEEKKEEKKPEPPPPPKKTAKEVVTAEGAVFMFSLADSADAKKLADEDCAKKAKKDDKKLESCKKDAESAASGEGMRFEKDAKGDWWWISFGKEKDKEVVYNKVKFKIANESEGKLTLTPEGKDEGKKPMKTLPKEVVVDVPDESTVAMSDPKKGKLIFKKK